MNANLQKFDQRSENNNINSGWEVLGVTPCYSIVDTYQYSDYGS